MRISSQGWARAHSSRVLQGPSCAFLRLRSCLADKSYPVLARKGRPLDFFASCWTGPFSLGKGRVRKGASPVSVSQHTGTGTSLLTLHSHYAVLLPARGAHCASLLPKEPVPPQISVTSSCGRLLALWVSRTATPASCVEIVMTAIPYLILTITFSIS